MISSLRPKYIHLINNYKNVLLQRNNYLRQIKYENKPIQMLDIWDEQLAELSYNIYEFRKYYINKISEKINVIHNNITKSGKVNEKIKIEYISDVNEKNKIKNKIINNREQDIKRGFTSIRNT